MKRKNFKELKATIKGKNQQIKRLRKQLTSIKEVHKETLIDYHELVDCLKKEIIQAEEALVKIRKKKWYQFLPAEI